MSSKPLRSCSPHALYIIGKACLAEYFTYINIALINHYFKNVNLQTKIVFKFIKLIIFSQNTLEYLTRNTNSKFEINKQMLKITSKHCGTYWR